MKQLVLLILISTPFLSLAQTPTIIEPGEKLNSVRKKLMDGYTTQIGWTIKEGDTLLLGKPGNYNKNFAFIYQSQASWATMDLNPNTIPTKRYLQSRLSGRTGYVKNIIPIGARRPGYTIIAVIGIGEMVNYWVEIDNALDAGELLPPSKFADKLSKSAQAAQTVVITQKTSVADELKKLKELLDQGVISQEEFDTQKKKLLEQ